MNKQRKKIAIAGAGGFIGGELARVLLEQGHDVVAADIKPIDEWYQVHDCEKLELNLEEKDPCEQLVNGCDEVYNLACNMGGMGFIENNKALCMLSVLINTHLLMASHKYKVNKYFYASSACIYPDYKQTEADVTALCENDAYPAAPENGYGWEKLFSERLCAHYYEDFGLEVRIFRFHNVYGPNGTWDGGREKAPAAICRKVIDAKFREDHTIPIWGDGEQSRSFMYIDDCIKGMQLLMDSDHREPLNLGRNELVTINQLVTMAEEIGEVTLKREYELNAPQGVRGRNSDNTLIRKILGWEPEIELKIGLKLTYEWIEQQYELKLSGEKYAK